MKGAYWRVLPRDLFNESSLLFLYGRLWILLDERRDHNARIVEEEVESFEIVQNEATGGITIENLTFKIGNDVYDLERPLNSREKWSFLLTARDDPDFNEIYVFDDEGNFSEDMKELMGIK